MIDKVCIIGVGLIGGSFAKALKKAQLVKTIIGYDQDKDSLVLAKKKGVIDAYSVNIIKAIQGAEIIVIATPVNSIKTIFMLIKNNIFDSTTIFDTGSVKVSVIKDMRSVFAKELTNFIPTHPIAGKEKSGVDESYAELFKNKQVIITPTKASSTRAINLIVKLWQTIGAKVKFMSAQEHDDLLAMTSHLPHMLAFALMDYLINSKKSIFDYTAGGFKDFSRIASSDAVMWRDICINNSAEIIKHINGYQQILNKVTKLIINNDFNELEKLFINSKKKRDNWFIHE